MLYPYNVSKQLPEKKGVKKNDPHFFHNCIQHIQEVLSNDSSITTMACLIPAPLDKVSLWERSDSYIPKYCSLEVDKRNLSPF